MKIKRHMSKLDVFLWFTVKCYSEVFRSSHRRCFIRTPFRKSTSRRLQKNIDKFKECQTNESTEKIHLPGEKGKHETEGNELKYQSL